MNILYKAGKLLALGLGEAGVKVVSENLKSSNFNVMIPGKKVICIFGFCFIHKFTQINNELRDNVINFINDISLIVHMVIDMHMGSINKNLGKAFLVVWKFKDSDID